FSTCSNRIEEADTLNEAAIARVAAVGHGQVIERALLGAATGETNSYHVNIGPVVGASLMHTLKLCLWPERPRILRVKAAGIKPQPQVNAKPESSESLACAV